MSGNVVYSEKRCSGCGKISWDSQTGNYRETHVDRRGKSVSCDTNGEHMQFDADNNRVD